MARSPGEPLAPLTLTGRLVRLEPLSPGHHDGLVEAVRDGDPWRLWYTTVPDPDGMAAEIDRRLDLQAEGSMLPFTVFDADGCIAGMTSYMSIDLIGPRVEIGYTWYAQRVRRTGLNTEAKRLLLAHAFDDLGCLAVEFRTHVLNRASRRAIERLGAKLDGVLRCHMRARDGTVRDSCVYSIVAAEWPMVRSNLTWMLEGR